jgi:AraC-like DNA-binding protein
MKPIYERLAPLAATDVVACERVRAKDFGCQWHFHPELELTLVISGGTHRWVGDNISPIKKNDLVLLGPNLPHDYRNDPAPGARAVSVDAIVVQFHPRFLGSTWLERANMSQVKRLITESAHGLEITGQTSLKVIELMTRIMRQRGLNRLILLLEILSVLSSSRELHRIASPGFTPEVQVSDTQRMGQISDYIQKNLHRQLYLHDVAEHMGMTDVSFSRYFRSRTGKTFPAYLNELRVARICRLLAETDATVSEIALNCGFDSMANFEKQFRRLQDCSPTTYRQRVWRIGPHVD